MLTIWRPVHAEPVTAHEFVITRSLRYVQLALVRWVENQKLFHMANHDGLTGTANRRSFRARLQESTAEATPSLAVAFCDLDGFKAINDSYGHATGDAVLAEVARRPISRGRASPRSGGRASRARPRYGG